MNLRPTAPLRLFLALGAIGVAAAACQSQNPPSTTVSGSDLNNATSVPVSSLPLNTAPSEANGLLGNTVVGEPNAASSPNAEPGAAVGAMLIRPSGAAAGFGTCLTAAASPATDGTQVKLARCGNDVTQRWVSKDGRLSVQGNLCLTNDGAASGTTPSLSQLAAVLRTCNPNASEVRQHVEPQLGALKVVTGKATWALSVVGDGQLYWAAYDAKDPTQAFVLGARASNANAPTAGGQGVAVRAANANTCLAVSASTNTVALAPCDASSPSQAWQLEPTGQLQNLGRCLEHTGGTLSLPSCGQATAGSAWGFTYGWLMGSTNCLTTSAGSPNELSLQPCGSTTTRWTLGEVD